MNVKYWSGIILINVSLYFLMLSLLQFYNLIELFSSVIIPGTLVFDYFYNGATAIALLMAGIYLWLVSK